MHARLTLSLALALGSFFVFAAPLAEASYLPGATLDPSCLPTDPTCVVSTLVASSTANSFPYYAANGSVLSATSSLTILSNGNIGIGTTTPGSLFSLGGIANFTAATSTFYGTGGVNLTSGCFSIDGVCVSGGGSGTVGSGTTGYFPYYASNGTVLSATSSLSIASNGDVLVPGVSSTCYLFGGSCITNGRNFYIDSVNGSDSSNGTSPTTPWKTLGKLASFGIRQGDVINLARGSHFREQLLITKDNVTVQAYGVGSKSIIDGSDVETSWTKTAGYTSVYQTSVTVGADSNGNFVKAFENGGFMTHETSIANVDATADSYYESADTGAVTVYVHATGGGNPASNGSTYEVSTRTFGIDAADAGGGAYTNHDTVDGILTKNEAGGVGSIYIGKSALLNDVEADNGGKHNAYLVSGTIRNFVINGWLWTGANVPLIYYVQASAPGLSVTIDNGSVTASTTGSASTSSGIYGHTGDNSSYDFVTIRNVTERNANITVSAYVKQTYVYDSNVIAGPTDTAIAQNGNLLLQGGMYVGHDAIEAQQGMTYATVTDATLLTSSASSAPVDVDGPYTSGTSALSISNSVLGGYNNNLALNCVVISSATSITSVYNSTCQSSSKAFFETAATSTAPFYSDYNTFKSITNFPTAFYIPGIGASSFASWQAATGNDAHSNNLTLNSMNFTGATSMVGGDLSLGNTSGVNNNNIIFYGLTGAAYTETNYIGFVNGYTTPYLSAKIAFARGGGGGDGLLNFYTSAGNHILKNAMTIYTNGNVGIGTSTPYAPLTVWGPDSGATTTAFAVVNNASTTAFAVYDNGNATYNGSIFQSSDERLKTNVTPLDASSSLAAIIGLNPVSYTRIDQPGTGTNLGFLAQDVAQIFPELVSTTSPTALTPNGTLTLNYVGLIAPLVEAVKTLAGEVSGFAKSITTDVLTAVTGNFTRVNTSDLCLTDSSGSTCYTRSQLNSLLNNQSSQNANPITITDVPTCTLSASPASVTPGDHVTLAWNFPNAGTFSIDQNVGSMVPAISGTTTSKAITTDTTFTGTATSATNAVTTCTAHVSVTSVPSPAPPLDLSTSTPPVATSTATTTQPEATSTPSTYPGTTSNDTLATSTTSTASTTPTGN